MCRKSVEYIIIEFYDNTPAVLVYKKKIFTNLYSAMLTCQTLQQVNIQWWNYFSKKKRKLHLLEDIKKISLYLSLYTHCYIIIKFAMVDEANCTIKIHLKIIMSWCSEDIFLWQQRKTHTKKYDNNMKIINVAILIFPRPTSIQC